MFLLLSGKNFTSQNPQSPVPFPLQPCNLWIMPDPAQRYDFYPCPSIVHERAGHKAHAAEGGMKANLTLWNIKDKIRASVWR